MLNERPKTFKSSSMWLRWHFSGVLDQAAKLLDRLSVRPNTLTVMHLALALGAGWLAAQGSLVRAGVIYLVAGPLDALDGALARGSGRVTRFGAALDSILDRYAEGALLAGLAYWLASNGRTVELMLVFATLVGSLLVSYVRARAEGLGLELKVGLLTRVERYVLMLLTLFSGQLLVGLAIMAGLSNFTVLQRMVEVYRLTREDSEHTLPR